MVRKGISENHRWHLVKQSFCFATGVASPKLRQAGFFRNPANPLYLRSSSAIQSG